MRLDCWGYPSEGEEVVGRKWCHCSQEMADLGAEGTIAVEGSPGSLEVEEKIAGLVGEDNCLCWGELWKGMSASSGGSG